MEKILKYSKRHQKFEKAQTAKRWDNIYYLLNVPVTKIYCFPNSICKCFQNDEPKKVKEKYIC